MIKTYEIVRIDSGLVLREVTCLEEYIRFQYDDNFEFARERNKEMSGQSIEFTEPPILANK